MRNLSSHPHIGFLNYAKQFYDAVSVIVDGGKVSKTRIAVTYLYGHAIECAMKSILIKNGVPIEKLKKIGHDLQRCQRKVDSYTEKKFVDETLREIIRVLNPIYKEKYLEYHHGGLFMSLPSDICMQTTVGNLISELDKLYRTYLRASPSL